MHIPSAIRPEYFDAAMEKTASPAELLALRSLKRFTEALNRAEEDAEKQSLDNRRAAGENAKRLSAPKGVLASSLRAAEDLHKMEMRKCRRANSAAEILESVRQLLDNDITFWRPALPKIELQANREIAEKLVIQRENLRETISEFLAASPRAA